MSASVTNSDPQTGAALLVKSLEAQGVEYVFGIPGAKIDKVFDTLLDSKIKTVVCRHEQNAAFIAGGIGRMTGKAGVTLVTSGPGCSNLVTGLATANSEGDPVVAIGGAVSDLQPAETDPSEHGYREPVPARHQVQCRDRLPGGCVGSGRERLPHRRVGEAGCGVHQRPAGHHVGSSGRRRAHPGRTGDGSAPRTPRRSLQPRP